MANAQLRMLDDDTTRDVTVLRVDSSIVHALYELNQRYREIQSALFARGNSDMMIEQLKTKLSNFFDKAYANHSNKSPSAARKIRSIVPTFAVMAGLLGIKFPIKLPGPARNVGDVVTDARTRALGVLSGGRKPL